MRLAVRLAVALGQSISWVLALPAHEFDIFLAFYSLEPFGPHQQTLEAATIATATMNSMCGAKVVPSDLFPTLKQPPPKGGEAFRKWAAGRAPAMKGYRNG